MALISLLDSARSMRTFSTLRILPRRGKMAWKKRSRPVLAAAAGAIALHEENLGSRVAPVQSASLPGSARAFQHVLRRAFLAPLRAASRAPSANADHAERRAGFSPRKVGQPVVHQPVHDAAHLAVAQLGLGLPSNCGSTSFTLMTAARAFAHVLALEVGVGGLEEAELTAVFVDAAGERGGKAGQVRAALGGMDVVRKGVDVLLIGVVVLESHPPWSPLMTPSM